MTKMKYIVLFVCLAYVLGQTLGAPTTSAQEDPVRDLTILYTNDEHGWIKPTLAGDDSLRGGVIELYHLWQTRENYDRDDERFVVLSGGDNWTGPAISSFFEGEPAYQATQIMGYDATAIGNHEFDYGVDILHERMRNSAFPFVSANIFDTETDTLLADSPPFIVHEANDVRLGIIGLANVSTSTSANPVVVGQYEFRSYDETLQTWMPRLMKENVDAVVLLTHGCPGELRALASAAAEWGVDLMLGGHCHEEYYDVVAGVPIVLTRGNWNSYARLDFVIDTEVDSVLSFSHEIVDVITTGPISNPQPELKQLLDHWQARADEQLNQPIGYTRDGLAMDHPLFNLITDGWRYHYPLAEVAVSNRFGVRQEIAVGTITFGDIYSILPFNNFLVDVDVSGMALVKNLAKSTAIFSGVVFRDDQYWLGENKIDPDKTYKILLTDFMYTGGDRFTFHLDNPDGYYTGIDWRLPVIEYIQSLETSEHNPIENYLDPTNRRGD